MALPPWKDKSMRKSQRQSRHSSRSMKGCIIILLLYLMEAGNAWVNNDRFKLLTGETTGHMEVTAFDQNYGSDDATTPRVFAIAGKTTSKHTYHDGLHNNFELPEMVPFVRIA